MASTILVIGVGVGGPRSSVAEQCGNAHLKIANAELDAAVKDLYNRLENNGDANRLKEFRELEKKWVVFRDAYCDLIGGTDATGKFSS